ncbi:PREDICTED: uncharacterized protein LOC109480268 [Branchiostoma belcheri]|uniref:Uncharacterized protein LOC109480268 n=1 Tax=Branchiostoma belcheri TaxID=7741 RepID=A0A6P5A414_BRABE|nr:PREDICTED: uncharacterized protein LOC109480268 [Branchiostoma belcheri]
MSGEEQNTLTVSYSGRVLAALRRDDNTVRPRLDTRFLYTRSFPGLYPENPAPVRSGMPRHVGARVKRQQPASLPSLEVALSKKISSPRLDNTRVGEDSRLKTSHGNPGKMQREDFLPSWKERRDKLKPTRTTGGQTELEKNPSNDETAEQQDSANPNSTAAKTRETRYNQLPGLSTKIEVTLPTFQPGSGGASSPSVLSPLSPHGKVHLAGPMNKMDKIVEYSTQLKEGVIDYDMYMTKLALLSLQTQIRDVPRRSASKGPKGELRISKVNIEDAIDHISAGPLVRSDAPVPDNPEPLLYRKLTTTRPTIPHSTRVIVGHTLTRRRGADRSRYPRAPFPMYDWNLHQAETLLKRNFGFYNYNNATPATRKPPSRDVLRPLEKPPVEIRPKTFRLPSFGRIPTASREGSVDPRAALSSRGKLPTPAGSDVFQGHLKNVYASIEKAKGAQEEENGNETPIPIVLSPATEDTKPDQDMPGSAGRPDLLQLPSSLAPPLEVSLPTGVTVPALGLNVPGTPPLAVPGSPPPRSGPKLDPNGDNSLMVVPVPSAGEKTVSFSAKLEVFMPESPDSEATTDMDFV